VRPLEILAVLAAWTPRLAQGFALNLAITAVAMALGSAVGAVLALLRLSRRRAAQALGATVGGLARNAPTFVIVYYLAYLLPSDLTLAGTPLPVPAWLKAALALAVAVSGFVADGLAAALRDWRAGRHAASLLFIPSWTSYALVVLMASTTASVIGVGEIVSQCNAAVGATGRSELMLWVYLYAMLWFLAVSLPVTFVMRRTRALVQMRLARAAAT
jgi:polar amino acid transport system permease protein